MPTADCWLARWCCCIRRSGPSHAARLTAIDRLTAMICSHTGALADAEPVASATRLTARRCGGDVDPHGHRCAPALDRSACRGHITAPHAYRVSRRTNRTGVGLCLSISRRTKRSFPCSFCELACRTRPWQWAIRPHARLYYVTWYPDGSTRGVQRGRAWAISFLHAR
jgi:hypothetical protein